jgi:hypothetical protein
MNPHVHEDVPDIDEIEPRSQQSIDTPRQIGIAIEYLYEEDSTVHEE